MTVKGGALPVALALLAVGCADGLRPVSAWFDSRGLSGVPEAFRDSLDPRYFQPLPYEVGWRSLHEVRNRDAQQSGQAAIAMIALHAGWAPTGVATGPTDPADGRVYPLDEAVLGIVGKRVRPDADVRYGGLAPLELVKGLAQVGMTAHYSMKGDLQGVRRWVEAGWPVALLVDASQVGQAGKTLRWLIVHGVENQEVAIANGPDESRRVPLDRLLVAWDCDGFALRGVAVTAEGSPR